MDRVEVLGNGPSQSLFFREGSAKDLATPVVCCNLPYQLPDIGRIWATILGDFKMMRAINEGSLDMNHSMWVLGFRPKLYCDQNPNFYMKNAQRIREFYTRIPPYAENPTEWSAGHLAVHYTCVRLAPKELHLWGFDSMFSHDLSSSSDVIMESNREAQNRYRMNSRWRPLWQGIFDEMTNIQFKIHANPGLTLQYEVPDNVQLVHEERKKK